MERDESAEGNVSGVTVARELSVHTLMSPGGSGHRFANFEGEVLSVSTATRRPRKTLRDVTSESEYGRSVMERTSSTSLVPSLRSMECPSNSTRPTPSRNIPKSSSFFTGLTGAKAPVARSHPCVPGVKWAILCQSCDPSA